MPRIYDRDAEVLADRIDEMAQNMPTIRMQMEGSNVAEFVSNITRGRILLHSDASPSPISVEFLDSLLQEGTRQSIANFSFSNQTAAHIASHIRAGARAPQQ